MNKGSSTLDPELVAFVEAAIPSVWALETLILLKSGPERDWTMDQLVAELRANPALVADCVASLQRAGLAQERDGVARYAPASPGLAILADALQDAYRQRPVSLVNLIATRRQDPLKGFADSFRLGGRKP
ncbi:MAG TPA: hypothetical protein VLJ13_06370 [Brevundimonas sp.]|nr:hypothetical protein [Brevundimonas sp.]